MVNSRGEPRVRPPVSSRAPNTCNAMGGVRWCRGGGRGRGWAHCSEARGSAVGGGEGEAAPAGSVGGGRTAPQLPYLTPNPTTLHPSPFHSYSREAGVTGREDCVGRCSGGGRRGILPMGEPSGRRGLEGKRPSKGSAWGQSWTFSFGWGGWALGGASRPQLYTTCCPMSMRVVTVYSCDPLPTTAQVSCRPPSWREGGGLPLLCRAEWEAAEGNTERRELEAM